MTVAILDVPAAVPAATQRLFRLAAIATIALGCAATVGGAAVVISGVHLLQTRDLGLGGVGLVIGLILVCALLVLPGVVYLALAWPARRGRAWAIRSAISLASLHLLLALFVGLGAVSGAEPLAALTVGAVAVLLTGSLGCLLRCLAAARALKPEPRGFVPITARSDA